MSIEKSTAKKAAKPRAVKSTPEDQPIPGALSKPVLAGHKRYKATRVRYAQVHDDGTYSFSFISNRPGSMSGKNYHRKCTRSVYEKVFGRIPGNDITATPTGGLSQTTGRAFYVYENPETGVVEAITTGPGYFYNSKQNAPETLKDVTELQTIFYPDTGGFEVVYLRGPRSEWQLPSMPGDMKMVEFDRLVNNLDKESQVYPGQHITPEFVVTQVAGNRVTFSR